MKFRKLLLRVTLKIGTFAKQVLSHTHPSFNSHIWGCKASSGALKMNAYINKANKQTKSTCSSSKRPTQFPEGNKKIIFSSLFKTMLFLYYSFLSAHCLSTPLHHLWDLHINGTLFISPEFISPWLLFPTWSVILALQLHNWLLWKWLCCHKQRIRTWGREAATESRWTSNK